MYTSNNVAGALYGSKDAAYTLGASVANCPSQTISAPDTPALHQIGVRIETLACRLQDANITTRVFVERVAGGRPEPVQNESKSDPGVQRPAVYAILEMINHLERRVNETEYLSRELGRIG